MYSYWGGDFVNGAVRHIKSVCQELTNAENVILWIMSPKQECFLFCGGGCSPFPLHMRGGMITMDTNISLSDLLLFANLLTDVITLCYVVFSNKNSKK